MRKEKIGIPRFYEEFTDSFSKGCELEKNLYELMYKGDFSEFIKIIVGTKGDNFHKIKPGYTNNYEKFTHGDLFIFLKRLMNREGVKFTRDQIVSAFNLLTIILVKLDSDNSSRAFDEYINNNSCAYGTKFEGLFKFFKEELFFANITSRLEAHVTRFARNLNLTEPKVVPLERLFKFADPFVIGNADFQRAFGKDFKIKIRKLYNKQKKEMDDLHEKYKIRGSQYDQTIIENEEKYKQLGKKIEEIFNEYDYISSVVSYFSSSPPKGNDFILKNLGNPINVSELITFIEKNDHHLISGNSLEGHFFWIRLLSYVLKNFPEGQDHLDQRRRLENLYAIKYFQLNFPSKYAKHIYEPLLTDKPQPLAEVGMHLVRPSPELHTFEKTEDLVIKGYELLYSAAKRDGDEGAKTLLAALMMNSDDMLPLTSSKIITVEAKQQEVRSLDDDDNYLNLTELYEQKIKKLEARKQELKECGWESLQEIRAYLNGMVIEKQAKNEATPKEIDIAKKINRIMFDCESANKTIDQALIEINNVISQAIAEQILGPKIQGIQLGEDGRCIKQLNLLQKKAIEMKKKISGGKKETLDVKSENLPSLSEFLKDPTCNGDRKKVLECINRYEPIFQESSSVAVHKFWSDLLKRTIATIPAIIPKVTESELFDLQLKQKIHDAFLGKCNLQSLNEACEKAGKTLSPEMAIRIGKHLINPMPNLHRNSIKLILDGYEFIRYAYQKKPDVEVSDSHGYNVIDRDQIKFFKDEKLYNERVGHIKKRLEELGDDWKSLQVIRASLNEIINRAGIVNKDDFSIVKEINKIMSQCESAEISIKDAFIKMRETIVPAITKNRDKLSKECVHQLVVMYQDCVRIQGNRVDTLKASQPTKESKVTIPAQTQPASSSHSIPDKVKQHMAKKTLFYPLEDKISKIKAAILKENSSLRGIFKPSYTSLDSKLISGIEKIFKEKVLLSENAVPELLQINQSILDAINHPIYSKQHSQQFIASLIELQREVIGALDRCGTKLEAPQCGTQLDSPSASISLTTS